MSFEELEQEIAFQTVMLNSIDDSVEHRAEAEREVLAELRKLKKEKQERSSSMNGRLSHHTPATMEGDPFAASVGGASPILYILPTQHVLFLYLLCSSV